MTRAHLIRIFAASVVCFVLQGFTTTSSPNELNYELSVSTAGQDFYQVANKLYQEIGLSESELSTEVFQKALRGYVFLRYTNELENHRYLTIMDFSKSSNQKRLWLIDLYQKCVVFNELVAHGKNSGDKDASYFSNRPNSRKSSLGFYVTGSTYNGKHRYSLKLRGLEPGFNSNAFARGIVIHGAYYVSEEIAQAQKSVGRSFGCPAVSQEVNRDLVDLIKGGTCLFIYHPQSYYNEKSKILNNDQFIPIELLNALLN